MTNRPQGLFFFACIKFACIRSLPQTSARVINEKTGQNGVFQHQIG
jgi:hypothetical protein